MPEGKKRKTKPIISPRSSRRRRPRVHATSKRKRTRRLQPKPLVPLSPLVYQKPLAIPVEPVPGTIFRTTQPVSVHWLEQIVSIICLTVIGALTLLIVANYAQLTLTTIESLAPQSILLKPLRYVTQRFMTNAGRIELLFSEHWEVNDVANDSVGLHYVYDPAITVTLKIHPTADKNIFTWLENNQPTYHRAVALDPTPAIQQHQGILVSAQNEDDRPIQVVYFPVSRTLAEHYIIELTLTNTVREQLHDRVADDFEKLLADLTIAK